MPEDIILFSKRVSRQAGLKLLDASKKITCSKQGNGNFATEADLESEAYIKREIEKNFPGHKILAEETGSEKIVKPEKEANLWIVDPLDGTTNFYWGVPFCCVSIAYAKEGEVLAGAIYDPFRDELFWAEKGAGAFLNGKKIKVSAADGFKNGLVNQGSPYRKEDFYKTLSLSPYFLKKGARFVNFGSAALDAAYVAAGRLVFYWEWGQKPWDVAAAKVIVEEAGGKMEPLEGVGLYDSKGFMFGTKELLKKTKSFLRTERILTEKKSGKNHDRRSKKNKHA